MKKRLASLITIPILMFIFSGTGKMATQTESNLPFNELPPFNDRQMTVDTPYHPIPATCTNNQIRPTSLTNIQDKSNGPLKKYRIVSFYGHPRSTQMGILGQLPPNDLIARLKKQTRAYSAADPCYPAIPAIELIATVAGRSPGPKGLYYHETSLMDIDKYAQLAKRNGMLLILDVQLGRDSVLHQVQLLKNYLKLPYVHLAIDTEFHVGAGQIPGAQLGRVNGYHIEDAIQYVSRLTEENHLPDKVIVIHQFKGDVIQNKNVIKPTDHVELVLNFDGFGAPQNKKRGYNLLVKNQPVQYGGFKLFYKQDSPLLTPKDVLKLDPSPVFVDYQ
ncbi:hypothetical protein PU629_19645 [Pullulanibacillus sp. KACC 23026]|uniref:hypothetical protein n=1 Tax=Pullulanibacillus sp. KACC 23026 TaxID=3028315 RepID=UPI0023AE7352|nr:hypothetical protein [Pullulanibacillus sp. KACC 23026]WEG12283.1 hypothetical protein PU629_19645 [Pullulanibacillus sp. KACC 23026]